MRAPLRPPMPYAGGKQRVAAQIAAILPAHHHYIEPYAGALSVLLAKPPSMIETINDLNGDLMAFWRVLRERPDDLERVCALTPHSRPELQRAVATLHAAGEVDELEQARCLWVILTQRRSASTHPSAAAGWRFIAGSSSRMSMARYMSGYAARFAPAAERLRAVSIESRPALDVIRDYGALDEVCLYVDPPYLGSTRTTQRLYRHEMPGEADHTALLAALVDCRASVVLSGYASALYDDALSGWHRHEFTAVDQRSSRRQEVVWSNRRPSQGRLG